MGTRDAVATNAADNVVAYEIRLEVGMVDMSGSIAVAFLQEFNCAPF